MMDMATLSQIALVFSVIVSTASLAVSWFRSGAREMAARIEATEKRIQALELLTHHSPRRDEMHAIQLSMEKIAGQINVMGANLAHQTESMAVIRDWLGRHEAFLMDSKP